MEALLCTRALVVTVDPCEGGYAQNPALSIQLAEVRRKGVLECVRHSEASTALSHGRLDGKEAARTLRTGSFVFDPFGLGKWVPKAAWRCASLRSPRRFLGVQMGSWHSKGSNRHGVRPAERSVDGAFSSALGWEGGGSNAANGILRFRPLWAMRVGSEGGVALRFPPQSKTGCTRQWALSFSVTLSFTPRELGILTLQEATRNGRIPHEAGRRPHPLRPAGCACLSRRFAPAAEPGSGGRDARSRADGR
jgi:hypothetical protein